MWSGDESSTRVLKRGVCVKMWLGLTIFLVTVSFGLTVWTVHTYDDTMEVAVLLVLFGYGYLVPFVSRRVHVMTSALTLAGLGRLSTHHDVSLAALAVYVLAVFVGHP